MPDKVDLLIRILLDNSAREDERDDAAMDLGRFDDDRALRALLRIASNRNENLTVLDSCGESIAEILVKRNSFDKNIFNTLVPTSKNSAYSFIKSARSDWLR